MRLKAAAALAVLVATGSAHAALPTYGDARRAFQSSETRFLDRHGELIQSLRRDSRTRQTEWVTLDRVSPALVRAVLQAEDRHFREHAGVDWLALARAAGQAAFARGSRGGASTISMQVASFLEVGGSRPGHRDIFDKAAQVAAALRLERTWTKDQILEVYLNRVTFRGELVGVGAASRALFGRAPDALSTAESAVLAALLRAPKADLLRVESRARQIQSALGESCDGVPGALAALRAPGRIVPEAELAPHAARRIGIAGRAEVRTTLDRALQSTVRAILAEQAALLRERNVFDAAALVVENETGRVLAYVGGLGEASSGAWVDAVQAPRQAGSTLKPFIYGLAIDRRLLTAGSTLDDSPAQFAVASGMYRPRDYDNRYRGPVRAAEALAGSLNVPAVRVLNLVGVETAVPALRGLGFTGLQSADFYGPSLALGSADVSLWELATAYATLARQGRPVSLSLEPAAVSAGKRVLSARTAWVIGQILSDPALRAGTFGLGSPLTTSTWTAAKTGTSKDMRDNWCLGFTDRFTVGVWVGNYSGAPMHDVSGVSGAAPAWQRIVGWLAARYPSRAPARPSGVVLAQGLPYLKETVPAGAERVSGAPPVVARFTYPAQGEWIAFDPDLPAARQRIPVEWEGDGAAYVELDGVRVTERFLPLPKNGLHRLSLRDSATGRTLDELEFQVRGAPVLPGPS